MTNNGPSVSSGPIEIADLLPAGFSYVAGSAQVSVAGGVATATEPSVEDQTLTWSIGDDAFTLAPSATIVITLTTAIDPAVPAQTALVHAVTVDGPDDDDPTNNYDEDPTDVERIADMTIVKDVVGDEWIAGTSVEYTITVTNQGPSVADATVTDDLPTGLTATGISGSTGWECDLNSLTCGYEAHPVGDANASTITVMSPDNNVQVDGNTVIWTLEDGLQVDESVTLTLVVNVQQGAYPEITNTVTVDSAAEKTPESMLSDSATMNVGAADPLPITGGDMAALWVLLALLLLLGGTAAVLHARRKAALAEVAE